MNLILGKEQLQWRRAGRAVGFLILAAGIWSLYFAWRPPEPMLGLRHLTHLGDTPKIVLTFDDAPHPLTTPLLLAALKRSRAHASFFVVGDGLRLYPELAARIVSGGHRMGNHSQYHNNLTRLSPAEFDHEVQTCFASIAREKQQTDLFRPPGGGLNRDVMDYMYRHDTTLAWWSRNPGDWEIPEAWKIWDRVKGQMRAGDIMLLHDARPGTPQALLSIVRQARSEGLDVIPMPER